MPSLFSNEYSRGPLYQYWRERGQEEKRMRESRVQDAKLRSKGQRPLSPTFGPSSNDSYAHRATSGPPAYRHDSTDIEPAAALPPAVTAAAADTQQEALQRDALPAYYDTTTAAGSPPTTTTTTTSHEGGRLPSAEEEKARLRAFEARQRQISADAAVARSLSHDADANADADGEGSDSEGGHGKGKQPERGGRRKSSTAGKIGRWLADAASGYTKNQERW